ncbi:protein translocase subunit SecF [Streptomyces sp. NPDC059506]|uniref:protein translocase subunit SecF n=1 Tax=Streptomyces TaxID=1883 RepID=UPI000CAF470E|nr:protein translocase subunit SecF [Streptomyces sp. SCUT-3]PLW67746.1 protein translocase subunit SecF [Streptomyces sp. DJ]QMV24226.1 protein translocase subunit SecF [Streptomyces sp. SCUT-3]
MSRLGNMGARLYRGEVSFDFVGKRKIFYGIAVLITVLAAVGLFKPGLHYGIEFSGGGVFTTPATSISASEGKTLTEKALQGEHEVIVQKLGTGGLRIQVSDVDAGNAEEIKNKVADGVDIAPDKVDPQVVGASWGEQISQKALTGLGIFMVLVVVYLAIAFEWRMAVAALAALVHDLTITIGVYALVGFEVTPGTVIGLLTILGYSLYDTVVVFDGLKETTRGITKQARWTYSEAANHSLNQTLVRSINTTVVALLPVGALLFIGGGLLGAGMLNDIALSLFVGLAAGAYSSIFLATPMVADLKERTPEMRALAKRVAARRAAEARGENVAGPRDAAEDDQPAGAAAGDHGDRDRASGKRR